MLGLAAVRPAVAQIALPPLPSVPGVPVDVDKTLSPPLRAVDRELANLRKLEIRALVRRHRQVLDTDRRGAPIVRSEVVAIDPSRDALERARADGFGIARERRLDGLDLRIVVLRARDGMGTRAALRRLRRLDPAGRYDFNHLYTGSGAGSAMTADAAPAPAGATGPLRVGLVDSGVDRGHPALAGVDVRPWGCDGASVPDRHGTAVASLLAGSAATPAPADAVLYAADIYCGQPTGGAVVGLSEALAWLARERVAVINLSLVGPPNLLLEQAVAALARRGHVIVAAVGNDGPAAPPLYPAAYSEVIGVTAVDARHRVVPEAGRGPQVAFAAPGADLRAAAPDGEWAPVRGTSFAAPLVARLAAMDVAEPGAGRGAEVSARLAALALDLGRHGRDNTYGHGLIGADLGIEWTAARR